MLTAACLERDGAMTAKPKTKGLPKPEARRIRREHEARDDAVTLEHIWPQHAKAHGNGKHLLKVLACRGCNNAKGGRMPTDDELRRAYAINEPWLKDNRAFGGL